MKYPGPKLEESSCYRQPMEDGQWDHLLQDLRAKLQDKNWDEIRALARTIRERVEWLDPIMDRYCEITRHDCDDPCCLGRKIFYNRTDMLYLVALDFMPPPGQTRINALAPCRYLTAGGCNLPRIIRPYICVWFLCEAHMEILREETVPFQRRLLNTLQEIRGHRLRLESIYEWHYPEG